MDGQEGSFAGVKEWKERYWMRFLKGMVMDRNTTPSLEFCFHAKLTKGSELEFISPINILLIFFWVVANVLQPLGVEGRWIVVSLWICSLDEGIGLCPEEAKVESVVAGPSGKVSGGGFKPNLKHFGVPSIFQLFEDSLEVSFRSSFA
jgi:hypothetical protein